MWPNQNIYKDTYEVESDTFFSENTKFIDLLLTYMYSRLQLTPGLPDWPVFLILSEPHIYPIAVTIISPLCTK